MHIYNNCGKGSASSPRKTKDLKMGANEVVVLSEITPLFTTIPKDVSLMWTRYPREERRTMSLIIKISRVYLLRKAPTFRRKDKQVRDKPMGSSTSDLIADLVITQFKVKAFETIRPRVWIGYVDDTFVALEKHKLDELHNDLNTLTSGTRFTQKEECETILLSLDVFIKRQTDDSTGMKVPKIKQ